MLGVPGMLEILGGTMKINSNIQKIIDSKVYECAGDAEAAAAARHAWDAGDARRAWRAGYAWYAGYAGSAWRAWRRYENQF